MGHLDYWDDFGPLPEKESVVHSNIQVSDGYRLTVYELGRHENSRAIILVNPLWAPFLFMLRLAHALASHFRVISWECRGAPFLEEDHTSVSTDILRQAKDVEDVAAHFALARPVLLSWSNAGRIIPLVDLEKIWPRAVFLVAPSGISVDDRWGTQDAANTRVSEIRAQMTEWEPDDAPRWKPTSLVDEMGLRLLDLSLGTKERRMAIFKLRSSLYATVGPRYIAHQKFDTMCRTVPTMIFLCLDDEFITLDMVREAQARNPELRLATIPHGGHGVVIDRYTTVADELVKFVSALETGR